MIHGELGWSLQNMLSSKGLLVEAAVETWGFPFAVTAPNIPGVFGRLPSSDYALEYPSLMRDSRLRFFPWPVRGIFIQRVNPRGTRTAVFCWTKSIFFPSAKSKPQPYLTIKYWPTLTTLRAVWLLRISRELIFDLFGWQRSRKVSQFSTVDNRDWRHDKKMKWP